MEAPPPPPLSLSLSLSLSLHAPSSSADVLMLILSLLPVKSLLPFESVSKYWHSLIQNPSIISLHNNRSRKNESLVLIRYLKPDSEIAHSLVSNETPNRDLNPPFSRPQVIGRYLIGSANGIVCLTNYSSEIVLWNPAMREFRDSLALVTWDPPWGWRGKESLLCIWARDGDHWNKKYSIGPILGSHRALAFQQNGELLLLRNKDYRLVSYNLDTQNMKEHHREYNDSRPECPYILRTSVEFQVFTENLVSVKRCAY